MKTLSEQDVQEIIERVKRRLGQAGPDAGSGLRAVESLAEAERTELGDGIFPTIDEAVAAAAGAFQEYRRIGLDGRKAIVASIRRAMLENAERLAEMARAETGLGRVGDKLIK